MGSKRQQCRGKVAEGSEVGSKRQRCRGKVAEVLKWVQRGSSVEGK